MDDIKNAATYILHKSFKNDKHLKYVIISLGEKGVLVGELKNKDKKSISFTLHKAEKTSDIVNVNGAGYIFE